LFGLAISFILPALNISMERLNSQGQNNFIYIEETFNELSETLNYVETEAANNVNSFPVIHYLLLLGMCIAVLRVGFQLFSIYKNIREYGVKTQGKYKYVLTDKHQTTHSFFNFIFVRKSDYKSKQKSEMLLHEQIHSEMWHSLDLLLVGFLSIPQWFNPFIYLIKRIPRGSAPGSKGKFENLGFHPL
jgi:bla regulator protein BlaR1